MKKICFFRRLEFIAGLFLILFSTAATAQTSEYRAFWVDTFNTNLNNHADVLTVVNNVKAANSNMILAQVRRRGDSWYLNSLEPAPDGVPIAAGFDPLADLITTAHAEGIEVHAFVIMGAIWNKNPTVAGGPPTNSNHVFSQHGGFNAATGQIVPGPNNWLTRTLLPEGTTGVTFQGHRFGSDFWLDFGHEEAAAYSVDVLMHLVNNYDIDGLHLDRIRYPEIGITGQTPTTGANIGYNPRSVERFQIKNNIEVGTTPPAAGNAAWAQWRRDQVSNLVRRVYLNAIAAKPNLKISAATIVFSGGPATEAAWTSAEPYWRVYQDWRSWTQEGILDIAIIMNYKNENTAASQNLFNTWNEWTKNHQYNRSAMIGMGSYLNSVEGNLRQVRRSRQISALGNSTIGVSFYSMATTNIAVTANPFSIPTAGQNTPARSFAEFASALKTSRSIDGATAYEDTTANPTPIFPQTAAIPVLQWKVAPTRGHLKGFARRAAPAARGGSGMPLDTADVTITNLADNSTRTTATDGGGFYGGVDLTPGNYLVKAVLNGDTVYSCVAPVSAGTVTTADLNPETIAPVTTTTTNPSAPNSSGYFTAPVSVTLSATDNCTGVSGTEYSLDGVNWQPYTGSFTISNEGTTTVSYRSTDRAANVETIKTLPIAIQFPTAATGIISGRVTNTNHRGLENVTVTLSGGSLVQPIVVYTNPIGRFRFTQIPAGENYTITVVSKRHRFNQASVNLTVNGNVPNINFVGEGW